MKRDTKPLVSSFLSCEKDTETILKKLFVENRQYSDILKRLLVVSNSDALDQSYDVSEYSLKKLIDEKYIVLTPEIEMPENAKLKAFIVLSFDNFTPNQTNPEFRDCMIHIDVVCHHEIWLLGNYRQRPMKILGYIDGMLNKARLSGIGELNFISAVYGLLNDDWSSYSLSY